MIIEKNFDTEYMYPKLADAIYAVTESGVPNNLHVQKFLDYEDGEEQELWQLSSCVSETNGISVLGDVREQQLLDELEGIEEAENLAGHIAWCKKVALEIEYNWKEENTIYIKNTELADEYDLYAINRNNFA